MHELSCKLGVHFTLNCCVSQVRMDGSDGQTDLRMSMPQNVGAFYRESTKPDGSALCLGKHMAAACAHSLTCSHKHCVWCIRVS